MLPPPPAPLPAPTAPPTKKFAATLRLNNVDGSLTSLSEHKGFRNYTRAQAEEIGITGFVQRYYQSDVLLHYEGTVGQINMLFGFLRTCKAQGMIESFVYHKEEREIRDHMYETFDILKDHFKTGQGQGGRVFKGPYSDECQYDKLTNYSGSEGHLIGSYGSP